MKIISSINRSGKLPPDPVIPSIPMGSEVAFQEPGFNDPRLTYLICAGDDHAEFIQPSEYFDKAGSNAVYALVVTSARQPSDLPVYRAEFIARVLGMSKMVKYKGMRQHTCIIEPYARPGQEGANYYVNGRTTININSDSSMIDVDDFLIIPSYDTLRIGLHRGQSVHTEWRLSDPTAQPKYCVFDSWTATEPKTMIPLIPMGPGGPSMDSGLVMTNRGGRLTVGPFSHATTSPEFTFKAVVDALSLAAQGGDAEGAPGKLYWFCIFKAAGKRTAEAHIMPQGDPDSHAAHLDANIVSTCWTRLYYDPVPYSAPG